jgi:hypothetical protein
LLDLTQGDHEPMAKFTVRFGEHLADAGKTIQCRRRVAEEEKKYPTDRIKEERPAIRFRSMRIETIPEERHHERSRRRSFKRLRTPRKGVCFACSHVGHWKRDCDYAHRNCKNCGRIVGDQRWRTRIHVLKGM